MKQTHEGTKIAEFSTHQLEQLCYNRDIVIYQVELVYIDRWGNRFYLVEWQEKKLEIS